MHRLSSERGLISLADIRTGGNQDTTLLAFIPVGTYKRALSGIPRGNLSCMASCFTTLSTDQIRSNLACFMDVLDGPW